MKKIFYIIVLFAFGFQSFGQTNFYCTKNITLTDCKVNFINSTPLRWAQLDANLMTWSKDASNSYVIKDGNTQVTIKNDGCLISPTFNALGDSLTAWQLRCLQSGGGSSVSIPSPNAGDTLLLNELIKLNSRIDTTQNDTATNYGSYILNDSLRVYFSDAFVSDTANSAVLLAIHNLLVDSLDKDIFVNNDSLKVWFSQPLDIKSDTANKGILTDIYTLLADSLDKSIYVLNDSLRVHFSQVFQTDTANQFVLKQIHDILVDSLDKNVFVNNDSIRVHFTQQFVADTSNQGILNAIYDILKDSLDKTVYLLNDSIRVHFEPINDNDFDSVLVINNYIDSAIVRRLDTIIGKLTTAQTTDTLKGLVFTPKAKTVTNIDTLFNCKSISFGRKSTASGTLILTYEDGDSESFDVANDDLPTWVNGEFISFLAYKATGATGLILNTLGCSQTDSEICAKVKPIFDCTLSVPINCVGWGSASGVWNTLSGCWNTGQ